jgi:cell wall-associated NlpC family hydrolase
VVSARPHADRSAPDDGVPIRRRRPLVAIAAVACALVVTAPPAVAHAAPTSPQPSTSALRKKLTQLNNQIETLAEQFNGQRIQLKQAKRAARIAGDNAKRKQRALGTAQGKVRRLAATSYMTGNTDPSMTIATGGDPESAISQSTMLHHIATQDGAQVNGLANAQAAATRASRAATKRVKSVQKIVDTMGKKKDRIEGLVTKVQNKVFSRILTKGEGVNTIKPGDIPGNTLGDKALRAALSQQGKPYVWGAAGPSSYDCSGLMMWAYKKVGISLPHYTVSQWNASHHVSHPQPGDLILFYPPSMHHVGMYIGNGLMVHAPQTGDVVRVAKIGDRPIAGYARPY